MKTTELIKRTCPMCGRVIRLKEDETMAAEDILYLIQWKLKKELTASSRSGRLRALIKPSRHCLKQIQELLTSASLLKSLLIL